MYVSDCSCTETFYSVQHHEKSSQEYNQLKEIPLYAPVYLRTLVKVLYVLEAKVIRSLFSCSNVHSPNLHKQINVTSINKTYRVN